MKTLENINNFDNSKNLKFYWKEGEKISDKKIVKVIKTKHIIEVVSVMKNTSGGLNDIVKLDKTSYMIKSTGELKDYKLTENRAQNQAGAKESFKNFRRYANNNFDGQEGEKHIILTYKENMTDLKRLHKDYKKFWEKFKYKYPESEYICVVEPQGRGAWHCHILMKTNQKYIKNSEIEEMWGQGFTKTLPLTGVDNIGAYLSAYLSDLEIENYETPEGFERIKENEGKKYIKGARLKLYPAGMKIFRTSKGIIKPVEEKMKYSDIKKIVGTGTPNYSKTLNIAEEDKLLNKVTYEQYNLKRLKLQE